MKDFAKIGGVVLGAALLFLGAEVSIGLYAFTKITAAYKSFFINKIDLKNKKITIVVELFIKNPSPFSIVINSYNFNFLLNGFKIGNTKSEKTKEIAGKSYSVLSLPIEVDFNSAFPKQMVGDILNYFISNQYDKIILMVDGKISGSTLKIPINKNIELNYSLQDIQKIMDAPTNK
jgi:LEA14-like dessication related protein